METYRRMFKVFENFLLPHSKVAFRHEYFIMLACWLLQSVAIDLIIQKISKAQLYRNPQVESGWRKNAIIIWSNLNDTSPRDPMVNGSSFNPRHPQHCSFIDFPLDYTSTGVDKEWAGAIFHRRVSTSSQHMAITFSQSNIVKLICILFFSCSRSSQLLFRLLAEEFSHWNKHHIFRFRVFFSLSVAVVGLENVDDTYTHTGAVPG